MKDTLRPIAGQKRRSLPRPQRTRGHRCRQTKALHTLKAGRHSRARRGLLTETRRNDKFLSIISGGGVLIATAGKEE